MRRTAAAVQSQMPRLGSDDPFRPDMYARVQNIRSNLMSAVSSQVWRGHGSWSTSAKHQRVTVKIRYRGDAAGADAYAKYMTKDGKGLDGAKPQPFNEKEEGFDAPARVKGWMREGDERWFKIVFSPEKKFGDLEGMVINAMTNAEKHLGTNLDWFAVRHYDGEKDHVHVFLRGRDDEGNTLSIDKQYIKFGFRDSAQRYVTYDPKFGLGERSWQEIEAGKVRAAELREIRDGVRALVLEARKEGLLDQREQQRISKLIHNASPKLLDEIKQGMRDRLDTVENVWGERVRSAGVSVESDDRRQRNEPVTKDSVSRAIEAAERSGAIDALDADRFRQSLGQGRSVEQINKEVGDAVKARTGTGRDAGRSEEAERIRKRGGISL